MLEFSLLDTLKLLDKCLSDAEVWCQRVRAQTTAVPVQTAAAHARLQLLETRSHIATLIDEFTSAEVSQSLEFNPCSGLQNATDRLVAVQITTLADFEIALSNFRFSCRDVLLLLQECFVGDVPQLRQLARDLSPRIADAR